MRTSWILTACFLAAAAVAPAEIIVFSGNFTQDDDVQYFHYRVDNTGPVTVSTTSFAGGGFSPILTLFDPAGAFLFDHAGYGTNSDATLSWNSLGGVEYIIALTQYDNYANGPELSNGFVRDGQGNFTAEPPFNPSMPGGSFLLPGPEQRTSAWSIEFSSADPTLTAAPIPEPSTAVTGISGALLLAAAVTARRRKKRT